MKKAAFVFGIFFTLFFMSCEGPQGPPGFDGRDGPQGPQGPEGEPGIQGQVFEVRENLDYIEVDNIYNVLLTFEDYTAFEILPEDAVLVYRFEGVIDFEDGSQSNAWGLLPQNFFLEQGTLQYGISHTSKDVEIFIEGNFNLSAISTDFTDDQIFRIVIVPSVAAANAKMDKSNIDAVMRVLGVEEKDVQKIVLD